ncbi:MAG: hypothetical protein AABY95_11140 [Pseudomonadota bacterium]
MYRCIPKLLSVVLLLTVGASHAATPADGTLTDASGPVTFTGGPFVVPNIVGTVSYQNDGPLLCDAAQVQAMLCDSFTVNVSIPEKFRSDDKNKKEVVQMLIGYVSLAAPADAQVDFDVFVFDAAGAEIGRGISNGGIPETITVPLSALKDGSYVIKIIPAVPLGASYTGEVRLGRGSKSDEVESKDGSGLMLGAFGVPALLTLLGLALPRRRQQ